MTALNTVLWIILVLCQLGALYAFLSYGRSWGRASVPAAATAYIVTMLISLVALRHSLIDILVLLLVVAMALQWLPAIRAKLTEAQRAASFYRIPSHIGFLCLCNVIFVPHGASRTGQGLAFAVLVLSCVLIVYVLISGQLRKVRATRNN